jgi:flagellar protein FlgJ
MPNMSIPVALPGLPPPSGLPAGGTSADRLRRACQDFESLFIYKLLEQMRATVPQEGYIHSGQEDVYSAVCDQQVAVALARSGGIGLAELLYRQLAATRPAPAASESQTSGPQRPAGGPAGR